MIEIWECDYDAETKPSEMLKKVIEKEKNIRPSLNPRDALELLLFPSCGKCADLKQEIKKN